jgi:hypothetical protein
MPGGEEREVTEAITHQIFAANGVLPLYEDERITVYPVPEPGKRGPFVVLQPGWSPRQVGETGEVWRELEAGQAASFRVVTPDSRQVTLDVVAPAGGSLHLLDAAGREIASWAATGQRESVSIGFLEAPGEVFILRYDGVPGTAAAISMLEVSQR